MKRRWIIRGFSIALLLLCVSGWAGIMVFWWRSYAGTESFALTRNDTYSLVLWHGSMRVEITRRTVETQNAEGRTVVRPLNVDKHWSWEHSRSVSTGGTPWETNPLGFGWSEVCWGISRHSSTVWGNVTLVTAPLWLPAGITSLLVGAAFYREWRRWRRKETIGLCPQCNYDLRASKERCPECGLPIQGQAEIKP